MSANAPVITPSPCELMPRLTSSVSGVVRWRWSDLDDMLTEQLRLLAASDEIDIDEAELSSQH